MIGLADRAKCLWPAECPSQLGVSAGLAIWNAPQRFPAELLESCALHIEIAGEIPELSSEISAQLLSVPAQALRGFNPMFLFRGRRQFAV